MATAGMFAATQMFVLAVVISIQLMVVQTLKNVQIA